MRSSMHTLKWIYGKIKSKIWSLIFLTVLSTLISVISVKFALTAKTLIDSIQIPEISFLKNSIYLGVLVGLQLITEVIYSLLLVRTEGKIKVELRSYVFKLLLKKDYCNVTKFHSGDLLNRVENDAQIITSGVTNIIPNTFALITQVILSVIALYTLDKSLALICILIIPVVLVTAKFYSKFAKPLHKEYQKTNGITHSFILESLQNLLVLKSFVNENAVTDFAKKLQQDNYKIAIKRNKISLLGNVFFYLVLNVGFYFSLVWCVFKISAGVMTFGTLTAVLQLVSNVQSPFKSLSGVVSQVFGVVASAERLIELEQLKDDKIKPADHMEIYKNLKSIDFNKVTFRYDDGDEDVLNGADMTIKKGEFVAIQGASGIGKSTFFKLIMAIFTATKGNITLTLENETMAVDNSIRKLFAYVPQTNMLLSGTIYDNIKFYKDDITKEQIIDAAKIACIWDYIKTLPDGLNTTIGERGLGLSEGQIQRIAIARAIVQNSPVILLDEATSALDEETEAKVLNNLKEMGEKTLIIISHRPKVFEICDKTIVFEDKKIIEKGL